MSNMAAGTTVPPLKPGDHLTRDEFEWRYEAMPRLKRAELPEGIVQIPAPLGMHAGGCPNARLFGWPACYQVGTPGTTVGAHPTVRLDSANEPQPTATLIVDPSRGGQVRISPDDLIEGGPERVAEVTASRVGIDLNTKLHATAATTSRNTSSDGYATRRSTGSTSAKARATTTGRRRMPMA